MTSPRTAILVALNAVLPVLGPGKLDLRTVQLTIALRTWQGGYKDAPVSSGPAFVDALLVIPKIYEIRQITTAELVASGGTYQLGDIMVVGIIPNDPANPGVGFTPEQLAPVLVKGQELIYEVTGPLNGWYALRELRCFDPFSYDLVLKRRFDTPAVL
jgi:hypothetical protein